MKYLVISFLSLVLFFHSTNTVYATVDSSSSIILFQFGTENMGVRKKTFRDGVSSDYLALTNPNIKIENLRGGSFFKGDKDNGPGIIINSRGHWLVTGTNHGKPFIFLGVSFYSTYNTDDLLLQKYIYFTKIGIIFLVFILIFFILSRRRNLFNPSSF